jgi:O-methyltransferase
MSDADLFPVVNVPDPRLMALILAVQYVYECRVEGDLIEFGVRSGYTAGVLLEGVRLFQGRERDYPKDRLVWLCDSYEGFPVPDREQDRLSPMAGIWREGTSRGVSGERMREAAEEELPGQVEVVEGWYKDTATVFAKIGRRYGLIHCDCDLYGSTMDALVPLFVNGCIQPGCIILFDDWNAAHADPTLGQRLAWRDLVRKFWVEHSDEGSYGASGHKYIVHGYKGMGGW